MPQTISKIKDDLQFVWLLSCFEGHPSDSQFKEGYAGLKTLPSTYENFI